MKWLLGVIFTTICFQLNAQYENIWAFGKISGGLDFNTTVPQPFETFMLGFGEGCASVCDDDGTLLFYTEGSKVWDKNHNLMPNGTGLVPIPAQPPLESPTSSTSQGVIIVPMPTEERKYYIFSLTSFESDINQDYDTMGRLYYSVVDMTLNGGEGDVIISQKSIPLDSFLVEKMTAVVGEYQEVWLLTCSQGPQSNFKSYRISSTGISAPVLSPNGLVHDEDHWAGCMVPSPDRRKLAVTQCKSDGTAELTTYGGVVYDFDITSGIVSNPLKLKQQGVYGVSFSSDNSKIYFVGQRGSGAGSELYQYNLNLPTEAEIQASEASLGVTQLTQLKLAPDGKIYFNASNDTFQGLGAIVHPNQSGSAASFSPTVMPLNNISNYIAGFGLPNIVPVQKYETHYDTVCFSGHKTISLPVESSNVQWHDGDTNRIRTFHSSGTFSVAYYTLPAVYNVDTFIVSFSGKIDSFPQIQIQAGCKGEQKSIAWIEHNLPNNMNFSWYSESGMILSHGDSLLNVDEGQYRLIISSSFCDTLFEFQIKEESLELSFKIDSFLCRNASFQPLNLSDFDTGATFIWNWGDGIIDSTLEPVHSYSEAGHYIVSLSASGVACFDSLSKMVTVDNPPKPIYKMEPKQLCVGQSVSLLPILDSTTTQIKWKFDNQIRLDEILSHHYHHTFDSNGTYPITLTIDSRACPDTSVTDSIYVYPLPEVDLGTDSSLCLQGQPIYLKNFRNAPLDPYHQVWSTGDTTEVLQVVHPGIYTLSVTAEPIGCTTTETIVIEKDCYVDIPNAFTPNGDGHNDYFLPWQLLSEGLTRFHMQVFNRWGQVVFETQRPDGRGWDGQLNGKAQPTGVYLYRIEADFSNGRQEYYEGNVTLIR